MESNQQVAPSESSSPFAVESRATLDNYTGHLFIGIDMGGTTMKIGLVDEAGAILARNVIETPNLTIADNIDAAVGRVVALSRQANDTIRGIGVAVPGAVDDRGRLRMAPNVKIDLDALLDALQRAFPPAWVRALNDANAAAYGEQRRGAAAGKRNVILVTLGTGVGGGVVTDGKVSPGSHGIAGEIGHICVKRGGALCNCGRQGCLEQYASTRGLVRMEHEYAAGQDKDLRADLHNALEVFDAYQRGEQSAACAVESFCDMLGFALANVACMVDPEVFLIGGGISGAFDLFAEPLRKSFEEYALPAQRSILIRKAALGNDAGMVGAALYSISA